MKIIYLQLHQIQTQKLKRSSIQPTKIKVGFNINYDKNDLHDNIRSMFLANQCIINHSKWWRQNCLNELNLIRYLTCIKACMCTASLQKSATIWLWERENNPPPERGKEGKKEKMGKSILISSVRMGRDPAGTITEKHPKRQSREFPNL